ncbi:MAG: DUF1194 domain-containing protein [Beijerinckiaceae bacterium]
MHRFLLALFLCMAAWGGPAQLAAQNAPPASEPIDVDVELVIAVDISYSMDLEELALQREGYAQAFRSAEIKNAIANGQLGRIAVTYFDWADSHNQQVVVPWTVIANAEDAESFADKIAAQPIRRARRTSISGAIDFGVKQIKDSPFRGTRQVIDVSGDGPNNSGTPVAPARDAAVQAGITINGLPIVLKRGGWGDIDSLDLYYEDCVIGGPRAFMVPIRSREEFLPAIRQKLLLEIADLQPPRFGLNTHGARIEPAQARQTRPDCMVGERQWRQRWEQGN